MPETAVKNKVVTIHYTLRDDAGEILDSSRDSDPLEYLHGYGGIVPGLERALEGKAVGDKLVVDVAPKDGYGEPSGPGPRAVPRDAFPDDVELEKGLQFFAPGPKGILVRVTFDSEPTHSVEQQQAGWQAILDNFARHVEAKQKTS